MYMIEERFSSDPKTLASLDNAKDILSTDDVLKNLNKSYKYSIDKESYIRARIFDMLIGDWDRHSDQWKWAEYEDGKKLFTNRFQETEIRLSVNMTELLSRLS
jgi:hypothetical protein